MLNIKTSVVKCHKLPPEPWAGWMKREYKFRIKSILSELDLLIFIYPYGSPCSDPTPLMNG